MKNLILSMVALLFVAACSTAPVPKVTNTKKVDPLVAWERVLQKYVNNKGQTDFEGLRDNPQDLHIFVEYISRVSPMNKPEMFKTDNERMAFYLNSYNALSMYNVIDSEIPETLAGARKVGFFYFKKLIIGGEKMSLYSYENDIIRKVGEEKVHFALNCMAAGCPRLPRKPFTARNLKRELNREAWRFFNEERNVRVDHKEKAVYLSEILDFFPEDFEGKADNLIAYANRFRKKKNHLPEDYKVKFIPYDWTVNNSNRFKNEMAKK